MRHDITTVSVIISSFNNKATIEQAINSAMSQSSSQISIECIVVDDCSTDGSIEYLDKLKNNYKFNLIKMKKNSGLPVVRNAGLAKSSGDYVNYLDGDDYFYPQKLKKQILFLQKQTNKGVCISDCRCVNEAAGDEWLLSSEWGKPSSGDLLNQLLYRNRIAVHTALIPRDIAIKYASNSHLLAVGEDYEMWLRMLLAGVNFYYIDEPLVAYRRHSRGKSQERVDSLLDMLKIYRSIESYLHEPEKVEIINYSSAKIKIRLAELYIQQDNDSESALKILRGIPRKYLGKREKLVLELEGKLPVRLHNRLLKIILVR